MEDLVNFGEILPEVNEILQKGVALYRRDRNAADLAFREALALAPDALPTYFCLYKVHTYQGNLDEALTLAQAGLAEAARQAGLAADWTQWRPGQIGGEINGPARFALYTLKALAFIHLRRGEPEQSQRLLDKLTELGALTVVGGSVIADLSKGLG
jgi:hypothetical protein